MFPIGVDGKDYDQTMVEKFDALITPKGYSWKLRNVLPRVLVAGDDAGQLTESGAKFLDPASDLLPSVSVSIRYLDFKNRSHQCTLDEPADTTREVYETSKRLLSEMWTDRRPLRLLSVALTNLTKEKPIQSSRIAPAQESAAHTTTSAERKAAACSSLRNSTLGIFSAKFRITRNSAAGMINSRYYPKQRRTSAASGRALIYSQ